MVAQSRTLTSAGPRLSTATRSYTGDPGRAGALRLALLAGLVALGAGAAALYVGRNLLEQGAVAQLEATRAAVAADVSRFTGRLRGATADLADDPRLVTYLRDAQRKPAGRQRSPAPAVTPPTFLTAIAEHRGWTDVLLVDERAERVLWATGEVPKLDADAPLAAVARRAATRTEPGSVTLVDAGPDPAFGDEPMLYAAAPVREGASELGTLLVAIGAPALEAALRASADVVAATGITADSTIQIVDAAHAERTSLGLGQGQEDVGTLQLAATEPALEAALQGTESAGRYVGPAGAVLAAYGPLEVGEARWAVGIAVPEAEALAPLRPMMLSVAIATVLAALLGWFLGGRLWRQFSVRLQDLSTVLARAQRGDRQARLEAKQDGAVGELAAAINRLLEDRANALARAEQEGQRSARDAESLLTVVREVSSGNLARRAEIEDGALGNVSMALNEMLEGIGGLIGSLRDVSGRVGESATQIRGCAEQTSSTAVSQARECSTVLSTAQALRAGNEQISQQCTAAVDVARRTEQASRLGQGALADLISGMDGLQRETRAATVKIKRLGERSMQISAITGTISKMSAQTDMLALNAAIEASRAGEHGQGFTVVAEEVRKLAERAAAAAKEVERLIAGIQSDVSEAVSGMERQAERLEMQTAAASQAEHALERVHAVTNEATTMLEEIAGAAAAQLERAGDIDSALKRIAEGAKGVQQTSEQARRTTSQLLSACEELGARASHLSS